MSRPPSLWPALVACAVAALWIDLSPNHHGHQADSLIPILASLYSWRPFYWGQDRFGMLLPLLAMPFRHPFVNLLVQSGLSAFAGLAALFLLPRYVVPDRTWPAAGLAAAVPFLVLAPAPYRFQALSTSLPYCLAAALGLGGLLLLERPRRVCGQRWRLAGTAGGCLCLALAHWVNVTAPLLLGPVLVARWLAARASRRGREARPADDGAPGGPAGAITPPTLAAVIATLGGCLAGLAAKWLANVPSTSGEVRPTSEWIDGTIQLVHGGWDELGTSAWAVAVLTLLALGVLWLLVPAGRRGAAPAVWAALGLLLGAVVGTVAMGAADWVRINRFATRYLMSSLLLAQTAMAFPVARPLAAVLPLRRAATGFVATTVALLVAVAVSYGAPSLGEVRAVVDDRTGHRTAEILAARCTHVAGAYWWVWPAVFHANLTLYERGERGVIWGMALRGDSQRSAWRRVPRRELRIAVIPEDGEAYAYLERAGFRDLVVVLKSAGIWVLRPAEATAPGEAIEPFTATSVVGAGP